MSIKIKIDMLLENIIRKLARKLLPSVWFKLEIRGQLFINDELVIDATEGKANALMYCNALFTEDLLKELPKIQ